jgi:stress response protein YsnF
MSSDPNRISSNEDHDTVRIPLVEEDLTVGKKELVTGRVRVKTSTETVEQVAQVDLDEEHVEVFHVPVGIEVDTPPQVRVEGEVTIIPVLEEILVVEKRLFLREEVHIRRSVRSERVSIPVQLRKQTATVEQSSSEDTTEHQSDIEGAPRND